jgi:hypothetical protein
MARGDDSIPLWFQLGVAALVLGLWTASVMREMSDAVYQTPTALHGMAAMVVPAILGRQLGRAVIERTKNGNGNDK